MSYFNDWLWVKNQDMLEMWYNGSIYCILFDFFVIDMFLDIVVVFI